MHSDLVDIGWTENQWNRISAVVSEEAQKARVAAQMLPLSGPADPTTVAIPQYRLNTGPNPASALGGALGRLEVNSDPTLHLTTLSVNVALHTREVSDPDLNAGLVMFRRAANFVARLEDALVFGGRGSGGLPPFVGAIPAVFDVKGSGVTDGLMTSYLGRSRFRQFTTISAQKPLPPAPPDPGSQLVNAIINATSQLDGAGYPGPYACALAPDLFADICTPSPSLVLPRDRVLPILQGPLLRCSLIRKGYGVVVALSGSPIELFVASDINVRFLQTTLEPRYVFRVSEKVALRIKEDSAIAVLMP
jgi:uncharacterized linocin/CFP29 family protein